jgi:hypothetical protein
MLLPAFVSLSSDSPWVPCLPCCPGFTCKEALPAECPSFLRSTDVFDSLRESLNVGRDGGADDNRRTDRLEDKQERLTMAQAAKEAGKQLKIVVCGGNGFLGKFLPCVFLFSEKSCAEEGCCKWMSTPLGPCHNGCVGCKMGERDGIESRKHSLTRTLSLLQEAASVKQPSPATGP